jgi:hypothetical protein
MSFSIKDWRDSPDTTTPITAAALEDIESRLSGYTDTQDIATETRVRNTLALNVKYYGAFGNNIANDTTPIQNALNDAGVLGGEVYLPAGTYRFTSLTIPSNVTLRGAGWAVSKLLTIGPASLGSAVLNGTGATNVLVCDLTLDGANHVNAARGINITGNGNKKFLRVTRCRFQNFTTTSSIPAPHGNGAAGIYVWTADAVKIEHNTFVDCQYPIFMDAPGPDCEVVRNQIWSTSTPGTVRLGITFRRTSAAWSGSLCMGNTVENARLDSSGVGIEGHCIQVNNAQGVRVIGNYSNDAAISGIHLGSGSHGSVAIGNIINNALASSIYAELNIGSRTTIGTNGTEEGCVIKGNTIRNSGGYGISISYSAGTIVEGNNVAFSLNEGIFTDSDRVSILNNDVWNSYTTNGAVNPSSTPNVQAHIRSTTGNRNVIRGNHVWDNQTTPTTKYGIAVGDGFHIVADNIVTNAVTAPYFTVAGSRSNTLRIQPALQAPTFAASYTPDPYAGETVRITLTGNITINNPGQSYAGMILRFILTQDGTGGRTTSFGTSFKLNWTPTTTANLTNTITFMHDGNNWYQIGSSIGIN